VGRFGPGGKGGKRGKSDIRRRQPVAGGHDAAQAASAIVSDLSAGGGGDLDRDRDSGSGGF
jgi:hypothetical protein